MGMASPMDVGDPSQVLDRILVTIQMLSMLLMTLLFHISRSQKTQWQSVCCAARLVIPIIQFPNINGKVYVSSQKTGWD